MYNKQKIIQAQRLKKKLEKGSLDNSYVDNLDNEFKKFK